MKRKKILTITVLSLILTIVLSSLGVNGAANFSDYDFSKWELDGTSTITFADKAVGSEYSNPPAGWAYQRAAGTAGAIKELGSNKYFEMSGYTQIFTTSAISSKYYVFSADVKCDAGQNVVIFAKVGTEKVYLKKDAADPGNDADFYEQDRSTNKLGLQNLGATGLYLRPAANKLVLYIKTYDTNEGAKIGNEVYELDAGVDFSTDFRTVTLVDDGAAVFIYVGNSLVGKVTYSNSKKYTNELQKRVDGGTAGIEESYYSNVKVYNAAGTELGSHTNALLAVNGRVAVGNRNNTISIASLEVKAYSDAEGENPPTSDGNAILAISSILAASFVLVLLKKKAYNF